MAGIKFVDELPKSTRTGGGRASVFTDEVIAELKDNPNKWAEIETSTSTAAKFVKANKGFEYVTRTVGKKKNSKGNEVPDVKVYVAFKP